MFFSVIVPIYNAEMYLREAIDSIIGQSISFYDYIEVILINDGSQDSSEKICLEYKRKFPNNIQYIYTENLGPAAARNSGLEFISAVSTYVAFLDADDRLEHNFIEKARDFFLKFPDINVAVTPVYYFEKKVGQHKLNYRFNQDNHVIDIMQRYNAAQYYIGGVFLSRKILKNLQNRFSNDLLFWEDALFINRIIIDERFYGTISETRYWYRKRYCVNSIVDQSWSKKYRYTHLIKYGYKRIIDFSLERYNYVIPYVQYLLIYHMKLYLLPQNSIKFEELLDKGEREEFIYHYREILKYIQVKYILELDIRWYYKEFLIKLRSETNFSHAQFYSELNDEDSYIKIIEKKINLWSIVFKGYFNSDICNITNSDVIFAQKGKKIIYSKPFDPCMKIKSLGYEIKDYKESGFEIQIPLWYLKFNFGVKVKNSHILLDEVSLIGLIRKKINTFLKSDKKDFINKIRRRSC